MAGTVTLLSALLAAVVSPWFLLLTAFVGVNQWLYVLRRRLPGVADPRPRVRPALDPVLRKEIGPDDPPTDRSAGSAAGPPRTSGRSRSPGCSLALGLGVFAPKVETALSGAGWEATGSESVAARKAIDKNFQGLSSSALMVVVHSQRQDGRATRRSSRRSPSTQRDPEVRLARDLRRAAAARDVDLARRPHRDRAGRRRARTPTPWSAPPTTSRPSCIVCRATACRSSLTGASGCGRTSTTANRTAMMKSELFAGR